MIRTPECKGGARLLMLAMALAGPTTTARGGEPGPPAPIAQGRTSAGAVWKAAMPENWNGTVLLYGRGYSAKAGEPDLAPAAWRDALLARGYALVASNYGAAGWSLAEAVPAQREALQGFVGTYGKPRRAIAFGQSMGGLVTTALAELPGAGIDGAVAFCPSIGGAVGMMNMALDGAFAFSTLAAPQAGLKLVGIVDDMANGRVAQAAVTQALASPEGRARLALAGVLAGIPGWTRRDRPRPAPRDYETQVEEIGASFAMGVFLPRADQEQRAGGVFSWNTGIDYGRQLERSGRKAFVQALYRKAGLRLGDDLARLRKTPRIAAHPAAVAYMLANYTPSAKPLVPIVSVQAIGDGATSPSLQQAYITAASPRMAQALWLDAAGHCTQTKEQALDAIHYLEGRLDRGTWPAIPAGTITHKPAPMLRPCVRGGPCR